MKTSHIALALAMSCSLSFGAEEQNKSPTTDVDAAPKQIDSKQLFGESKSSSQAPDGMITVIREKGSWRFKILTRSSGWNTVSGISGITLRGDGYEIPIAISAVVTLPDTNHSYTYIVLTDEMVKSSTLVADWTST
jgi:hypothetical protein